jgi:hypothetical protein
MRCKIYSKHPWYLVTSSSKMVYRFCQIYESKIYDDKPDWSLQEEFEDTKGAIRIRISKIDCERYVFAIYLANVCAKSAKHDMFIQKV